MSYLVEPLSRMGFNMLLPTFDLMKNQEKNTKKNPKYKMIYMKEV